MLSHSTTNVTTKLTHSRQCDDEDEQYAFDVGVSTHDLLKRGVVVLMYFRVIILASSYQEAELTAYYMVTGSTPYEITELLFRF